MGDRAWAATHGLTIAHGAAGAREGPGRVWAQAGAFPLAALDLALLVGAGDEAIRAQPRGRDSFCFPAIHVLDVMSAIVSPTDTNPSIEVLLSIALHLRMQPYLEIGLL